MCLEIGLIPTTFFIYKNQKGYGEGEVTATETVVNFLTAYQSCDSSAAQYLIAMDSESNGIEFEGFQMILAQNIKYNVLSVEENVSQEYVVLVEITNTDFGSVFDSLITSAKDTVTDTELLEQLKLALCNSDAPTRKFECEILVRKDTDGKYRIQMQDTLSNALLGGYNEYINFFIYSSIPEE